MFCWTWRCSNSILSQDPQSGASKVVHLFIRFDELTSLDFFPPTNQLIRTIERFVFIYIYSSLYIFIRNHSGRKIGGQSNFVAYQLSWVINKEQENFGKYTNHLTSETCFETPLLLVDLFRVCIYMCVCPPLPQSSEVRFPFTDLKFKFFYTKWQQHWNDVHNKLFLIKLMFGEWKPPLRKKKNKFLYPELCIGNTRLKCSFILQQEILCIAWQTLYC